MNRIKNNKVLNIDLTVFILMFIVGIVTMINPIIGFNAPALYSSIIFFILTFFSFFSYFIIRNHKEGYENLFFSLICAITAAYLFVFEYASLSYGLGSAYLTFTLLNTINKIYHIEKLKKDNNSLWILRSIFLILILFLSILTIQNFYREISSVQTIMIGYFLITYGVLSIVEIFILDKVSSSTFEKFINGQFEEIKKPKMKKINKINDNVERLDEIVKTIDSHKNIRKKKAKITKK